MTMDLTDVTGCYLSIDAVEKMAKFFHPESFKLMERIKNSTKGVGKR